MRHCVKRFKPGKDCCALGTLFMDTSLFYSIFFSISPFIIASVHSDTSVSLIDFSLIAITLTNVYQS